MEGYSNVVGEPPNLNRSHLLTLLATAVELSSCYKVDNADCETTNWQHDDGFIKIPFHSFPQ